MQTEETTMLLLACTERLPKWCMVYSNLQWLVLHNFVLLMLNKWMACWVAPGETR